MKQLLAGQELLHPRLFYSLQAAITPVMDIRETGVNVKSLLQRRAAAATTPHGAGEGEGGAGEGGSPR